MRWSKLFIPTLREDPAEAKNATHRLLIRAGYMRRQDYLFLGRRALRRLVSLAREELGAIGAQELQWSSAADVAAIASELRSYKQLPQIWYQLNGFTAECRSLELGEQARTESLSAFRRIFTRCALDPIEAGASFLIPGEEGDAIARGNGYASTLDVAESIPRPPATPDPKGDLSPEEFHTPGQKTIADLTAFTGLPESSQIKSVVMAADRRPLLILLRGDHQLSEAKLRRHVDAGELRPARAGEIRDWRAAAGHRR